MVTRIGGPKHRADPSIQRLVGQTLAERKAKYQDACLGAHQRGRVGANNDDKVRVVLE